MRRQRQSMTLAALSSRLNSGKSGIDSVN